MTGWKNICLFVRHVRVSYFTVTAREKNIVPFWPDLITSLKAILQYGPFSFLYFSILFFLCAFPGLFGACATAYRDFFFTVRYSIKARTFHVIIRIVTSCLSIVQLFFN